MSIPERIPSDFILSGVEPDVVTLEELANLFRDINFLHDHIWLMSSPEFREFDLQNSYFYSRYGRPIPRHQRLRVLSVQKASPLALHLDIPSAVTMMSAAWVFFRILRAAVLLPGEIDKQDAEVEYKNLASENMVYEIEEKKRKLREQATVLPQDIKADLRELPGALAGSFERRVQIIERDVQRLNDNEIIVTDIRVTRYLKARGDE